MSQSQPPRYKKWDRVTVLDANLAPCTCSFVKYLDDDKAIVKTGGGQVLTVSTQRIKGLA